MKDVDPKAATRSRFALVSRRTPTNPTQTRAAQPGKTRRVAQLSAVAVMATAATSTTKLRVAAARFIGSTLEGRPRPRRSTPALTFCHEQLGDKMNRRGDPADMQHRASPPFGSLPCRKAWPRYGPADAPLSTVRSSPLGLREDRGLLHPPSEVPLRPGGPARRAYRRTSAQRLVASSTARTAAISTLSRTTAVPTSNTG